MQIFRLGPAVPGVEERHDHVRLDRARPEERDVDDEVFEPLRPELADELPLARAFDLEAAEGARGPDHREGRLVVQGHLGAVVEIDRYAVHPRHLLHGQGHR